MSTTATRRQFFAPTAGWREITVLMATAWLVPFLVHLIPWGGARPLGVYLLPVYWTTFLTIYFYGALPGLAVALVTPLVNLALTGLPALQPIGLMGIEAGVFVFAAAMLLATWPALRVIAPLAWFIAKAVTIAVQLVVPAFHYADQPWAHLTRSTQNGLAGLAILALINGLLVAAYPKPDLWERE